MIRSSEAIFAVTDVLQSIRFYRETLGFDGQWTWGTPPTFGGASWGKIQVMFCQQPNLNVARHQHFFRVEDVRQLYQQHQSAGADIVEPLESKPWGFAEYTVRDPNGYLLRFAGDPHYTRPATATDRLPTHIRVQIATPPPDVYGSLRKSVDWDEHENTLAEVLRQTLFCVVATDARDDWPVGMLRVCGDGRLFMIWDVIVRPSHQGQKIGSAMMEAAMQHLKQIAPAGSFVGLFTPKPGFYEHFGFVSNAGGMSRHV